MFFAVSYISAQEKSKGSKFQYEADVNFYLVKDASYLVPVMRADRKWLHLEVRANYEDDSTTSLWLGYNIKGGKEIEYAFTPMAGYAFGKTHALTTGIEISLDWKKFGFESESEYLFDSESRENNFFYSWSDLYYAPLEWAWIGYTGQRLRYFPDDLLMQHGFLIGGGGDVFEVNTYAINVFSGPVYYILSASLYF